MSKSTNRTLLRGPRPGAKASPVHTWMAEHPAARKFVADWLNAREENDTKWGAEAVIHHLRAEYDFPFNAKSALIKWIRSIEG